MKIVLSAKENSIESILEPRFGRAAYFVFVDPETMETEIVENSAAAAGGGAGITSGQLMVEKGVSAVITGNVGPNAMNVLKAAKIEIYQGTAGTIKDNIEQFKQGKLRKIDTTVPAHYGMGK